MEKKESEKHTKRISVLLTEEQFAELNSRRGSVPMSIYVRLMINSLLVKEAK